MIVGAQWGDEGKGKIVDLLAQHADLVCRYQGGPNAGHTIIVGGETFKLRADAVRDPLRQGVRDRRRLRRRPGGADRRARRSRGARRRDRGARAPLRQRAPDHAVARRDRPGERAPARPAADRDDAARDRARVRGQGGADRDPRAGPARPEDPARRRSRSRSPRRTCGSSASTAWSRSTSTRSPRGSRASRSACVRTSPTRRCSSTARSTTSASCSSRARRERCSTSTTARIRSSRRRTRSPRTQRSAFGIGPNRIDAVVGVSKAYVTRVGEGPFPTEIEGPDQERVRELGGEFGTVTGRERRCGWLDLVALRYAVRLNGITSLALTKLDVLSAFEELPVCVAYRLRDGSETRDFPAHQSDFHHAAPVYETLAGLGRAARRRRLGRRAAGRGARLRRLRRARARRRGLADRHRRRARASALAARARSRRASLS